MILVDYKIPIKNKLAELDLAIEAALKAGDSVMKIYRTDFKTKTKNDDSPITEADLKSNKIIKKVLSKSGNFILSEEDKDDNSRLENKKIWIIDPLDGTQDFVNKTGEFTIMIGFVVDKKPIIGVINWPAEKKLFCAQFGSGAFEFSEKSWKRINVSEIETLDKCRGVGSRSHLSEEEKALIEKLGIAEFSSIGSSLKVCKISSGQAELYLTKTDKMKEWDTCASYCIIKEAGGKMTDMKGRDISYNNKVVNHQNGLLVTNGLIHDKIIEMVDS